MMGYRCLKCLSVLILLRQDHCCCFLFTNFALILPIVILTSILILVPRVAYLFGNFVISLYLLLNDCLHHGYLEGVGANVGRGICFYMTHS